MSSNEGAHAKSQTVIRPAGRYRMRHRHGRRGRKRNSQEIRAEAVAKLKRVTGRAKYTLGRVSDGVCESLMEVVNAGVEYDRRDPGFSRIIKFGWGVFILIFGASYTANLAAFLGQAKPLNIPITNVDECNDNGCTICLASVLYNDTEAWLPPAVKTITFKSGANLSKTSLRNGTCDLALVARQTFNALASEEGERDPSRSWLAEEGVNICSSRFLTATKLSKDLPPQWTFVGNPARPDTVEPTISY